jgi:hypothetical protein
MQATWYYSIGISQTLTKTWDEAKLHNEKNDRNLWLKTLADKQKELVEKAIVDLNTAQNNITTIKTLPILTKFFYTCNLFKNYKII